MQIILFFGWLKTEKTIKNTVWCFVLIYEYECCLWCVTNDRVHSIFHKYLYSHKNKMSHWIKVIQCFISTNFEFIVIISFKKNTFAPSDRICDRMISWSEIYTNRPDSTCGKQSKQFMRIYIVFSAPFSAPFFSDFVPSGN